MFDCLRSLEKTICLFPDQDDHPIISVEEFNLLISNINQVRGFELPLLSSSEQEFSSRFFYVNRFERSAMDEIGSFYHYAHRSAGKLLSKKRIMELGLLIKFLSTEPSTKIRSEIISDLILIYLTIIVFVQDFPGTHKHGLPYRQKCDAIVNYLLEEKTIIELKTDIKSIATQTPLFDSKFAEETSANSLIDKLVELLEQLHQKLETAQQQKLISQDLKRLFCQEFGKSIRTCHLPSIHTRAQLSGHLAEASASCMLKPVFILLVSSLDVKTTHLEKWKYCIEIVHLCMRLVNDFFSYEREKNTGTDHFRNLAHILQNERTNELQARSMVVQLYNLLMAHYLTAKNQPLSEPEKELFSVLELVHDIPLFVWSELAA
ncbi:MAG: hypothetical protein F6J87_09210 [Spirulina sp. SIO3F2]|nr:hypothetical protein [Spirulina sp. SIO3F2]